MLAGNWPTAGESESLGNAQRCFAGSAFGENRRNEPAAERVAEQPAPWRNWLVIVSCVPDDKPLGLRFGLFRVGGAGVLGTKEFLDPVHHAALRCQPFCRAR